MIKKHQIIIGFIYDVSNKLVTSQSIPKILLTASKRQSQVEDEINELEK